MAQAPHALGSETVTTDNKLLLLPDDFWLGSEQGRFSVSDAAVAVFYAEVCVRAESIMAQTGTVSGAHYNAMRQLLQERGILATAEQLEAQRRKAVGK